MTFRSQKRKAVEKIVSGEFETPVTEDSQPENRISGLVNPVEQPENLEEMKKYLRKQLMSDLGKIFAQNQKERMKPVAPIDKKSSAHQNAQDADSETENISVARTSTPVKTNTTVSKTTPANCRNMVTGVLNDSTHQHTKKPKQQRLHGKQDKGRPTTSRLLFAPQLQTYQPPNMLPMPKALTASPPVFDHFKDLFRNNLKTYPHQTEMQKTNFFHSLLRGNALQASFNFDDTKKEKNEEVITEFKRIFGDFQFSVKARWEWDALHFDPTKKNYTNFSTSSKKLSKKHLALKPKK